MIFRKEISTRKNTRLYRAKTVQSFFAKKMRRKRRGKSELMSKEPSVDFGIDTNPIGFRLLQKRGKL